MYRSLATGLLALAVSLAACKGEVSGGDPHDGGPPSDAPDSVAPPDAGPPAPHGVDVLTQHNNLERTGANLAETVLDADAVASPGFGKLFAREVDDQIYAQPLIVSDLDIPGVGRRNVLFVATVNDSIYAFDADDPTASAPLWHRRLVPDGEQPPRNTDMTGACNGQYTDFSGNIGIVSTPVIDRSTSTIYLVARTHAGDSFYQRFHALDIRDGSDRDGSPVLITATVPGSGDGSKDGAISFDPQRQNQRSALTLVDGVVYMTWAGHCDWGPYHGWIMGFDAASLAQVVVHNTTPEGYAAGIWQSGQGMSSDGTHLFAVTGNGSVGNGDDLGSTINRGQSFLELARNGASLEVVSWFTPYNWEDLEYGDLDLGSAGMLLIPGTHLGVSGGKGGWLYVVDRDDMGGLSYDGSDDNVLQTFPLNDPYHLHGTPVYWEGPNGGMVYAWAEEDFLKGFPVLPPVYQPGSTILDTVNAQISLIQAPHEKPDEMEMPGAGLSISADGNRAGTGVVWASLPLSGNANQKVRPGILRAFDATDLTRELWNSRTDPDDDCGDLSKFSSPTIANGKVYWASFSGQVCVYGLAE
jgi:hypothetical protein